jgi:hypothetical protein
MLDQHFNKQDPITPINPKWNILYIYTHYKDMSPKLISFDELPTVAISK